MLPQTKFNSQNYQSCLDYIEGYWDKITHTQEADDGTLIGLPKPYIVPNTLMFKELYYWDSYFICAGLRGTARQNIIVDITENFLYLMDRFGRIPNASRYYFLSRSQPPFLSSFIMMSYSILLADKGEEFSRAWLEKAYKTAKSEYEKVWTASDFPDYRKVYRGLSRYYDINIWHNSAEAESGWDMTPRFDERCLDFLSVDLNCLLYKYEKDFMDICDILQLNEESIKWQMLAEERKRRVSDVHWDEELGFFYDYDVKQHRRSTFRSLAGFFPLWAGNATHEQALTIVKKHLPFFEAEYGLVTTEEWHPPQEGIKKQWAWPNGWAPLHWIVVQGLEHYGFHEEARRVAKKWLDLVNKVHLATGLNYEKYDVVNGCRAVSDRYPDQPGFAWTNSVFIGFVRFLSGEKL